MSKPTFPSHAFRMKEKQVHPTNAANLDSFIVLSLPLSLLLNSSFPLTIIADQKKPKQNLHPLPGPAKRKRMYK